MTAIERLREINNRLREMSTVAREANRDLTEAEQSESTALMRERSWLELEVAAGAEVSREVCVERRESINAVIRQAVAENRQMTVVIREEAGAGAEPGTTPAADAIMTATARAGAILPLTVGEIIKPLVEGVIYDKIGIRMPTGLAGDYMWPVVGSSLKVEFVGEGVKLTAQKIDLDKISANPQRLGVTAVMTRESIFNSRGLIEQIVREQMVESFPVALNEVILGGSAKANLTGPFATAGVMKQTVPFTFAELNKVKAAQLGKGYSSVGMVWVMSEETKALLECTPIDSGSGIMTIINDRLCGLPVHCSHEMGDKIGLGDFRYQVCGQFGTPSFVVDPITLADEDKVKITMNMYFSTTTLREDAFVIITKKA